MAFAAPNTVIAAAGLNQKIIVSGITVQGVVPTLTVDYVAAAGAFEGFRQVGTFD